MCSHSQLLNTTSGKFDQLFVREPPSNNYVNVATIAGDVSGLQSEISANQAASASNTSAIASQQATIDALIDKDNTLQDLINLKQDALTAVWPIHLNGNVISFGFWAALQATLAAHEATLDAHQLLLDQLVTLLPPVPPAADYVQLNGISSHISFPSGFDDVLDWTKSWSLGVDFYTLPDAAGDNTKASLFSSGGGHLTLHRSGPPVGNGVNWGSYNTCNTNLYNVSGRANANTWYSPLPDSRVLYSYDHTTAKLQYFIGVKGGGWNRRANISIPASFAGVQVVGPGLDFGLGFSGTGGANFSSVRWLGGVGDMVVSKHAWSDSMVTEYFAIADKDFSALSFYASFVWSWLRPGTYPELVDVKGNVAAGSLVGGIAGDFQNVSP